MKSLKLTLSVLLLFTITTQAQKPFYSKVNPFIGTGGHGHTYPGATMPFGMMQMSPDTRLEGWDGCGGYHYSDSVIYGFTHTHLSGTGIPDYCDILLMPFTGEVKWKNSEYASPFSHKNEKAEAGYYEVLLDKHNIKAALTTSFRSGMHEYTFPTTGQGKILLDLQHRDEVLESNLEIVNPYEIKGLRRSKSWANNQILYFYIKFDQPIVSSGIALDNQLKEGLKKAEGKNVKAYFSFDLKGNKKIKVKVGISGVSAENAKMNLDAEIKDFDFVKLRTKAQQEWNKELGKISIKGGSVDQQTAFYSALYHTMVSPNIYTDVNGEYRGTDLKVHKAENFTNYSVFSLWDTHRAQNPLQSIINRKRTGDWINTFLVQYKYGGMLPVWELSGNETFCMIGYHAVPVIVDAYQKGIRNFDAALALEAMTSYAESNRYGLEQYRQQGFVGNDFDHESASKTVEYAYDDWCISQFAKWQGNEAVYQQYQQRAQNYKNLFDPRTKHIRGKVHGSWFSPFHASEVNNFFTEGNSWHYSFTAQQDIDGLIRIYGGREGFLEKMNELFNTSEGLKGREQADVTGLIGQYAHGNEPSHHLAYLFNYGGAAWRTQEIVHKICTEFYPNNPDGLIGNEDCGQMSAWMVLSSMGFYPVTPGSGIYALGTPLFDEATIHLENGKTFTVRAKGRSDKNIYLNTITLNGKKQSATFIPHTAVANGGVLELGMTGEPNKNLGVNESDKPHSSVAANGFVTVPYFDMDNFKFASNINVDIKSIDKNAVIYYRINKVGSDGGNFSKYTQPFQLNETNKVEAYAEMDGKKTAVIDQVFYRLPNDKVIDVKSKVSPMYSAGGNDALIDGIVGTSAWKSGGWQSYYDQDFVAIVDLKSVKPISYVGIHVLQDVSPWIVYPSKVIYEISQDGINYQPLIVVDNKVGKEVKGPEVQYLGVEVKANGRFIRLKAITGGPLPAWHESAGNPTHTFIDEVIVK